MASTLNSIKDLIASSRFKELLTDFQGDNFIAVSRQYQ